MIIRPYQDGDYGRLAVQPAQLLELDDGAAKIRAFLDQGPVFAGERDDGGIAGLAGLIVHHAGYATAWALLGAVSGQELAAITQAMRRALAGASYRRIDMFVQPEFAQAKRWAWLLGFGQELRMHHARPDGGDWLVFARYRRDEG